MWNHSRSLLLTAWFTKAALFGWFMAAILIPFGLWRIQQDTAVALSVPFLLTVFCIIYVPVLLCIYSMDCLLKRIQSGEVFVAENVMQLRRISWCCFFTAMFLLAASLFQFWFVIFSGIVGFFGLLMRVVKNMLAAAIILKEENDYTV